MLATAAMMRWRRRRVEHSWRTCSLLSRTCTRPWVGSSDATPTGYPRTLATAMPARRRRRLRLRW
jgi:hypothetical protein